MTILEIDGQRLDLNEDTAVDLELFSPVFNDISEVGENYSYTIEVPSTANNSAIFGLANRSDYDTPFLSTTHSAALYIDGLPLFTDGVATLSDIRPDGYGLALTWGIGEAINAVWDKKLTEAFAELAEQPSMHVSWDSNSVFSSWSDGETVGREPYFAKALSNGQSSLEMRYNLPTIRAEFIRERLADIGITADFTNLRDLYFPLTTINGTTYAANNGASVALSGSARFEAVSVDEDLVQWSEPTDNQDGIINANQNKRLNVSGGSLFIPPQTIRIVTNSSSTIVSLSLIFEQYNAFGDLLASTTAIFAADTPEWWVCTTNGITLDANGLAYVVARIDARVSAIVATRTFGVYINIYTTLRAQYGAPYPLIPNLPDVTVGEFINTLCQLSGAYAYTTADGVLSFAPLSGAMAGTDAIDKSEQYTSAWARPELVAKQYTNSDYARRNLLKYDTAEGVIANGDGAFDIHNAMLDPEATIVDCPFTPTDMWQGFVYMPLWSDDGTFEGFDAPPIWSEARRFDTSLHFDNVLATYYAEWQDVVERWQAVTVDLRLWPFDLYALNWAKAWYIAPLGARYLPVRISYSTEGNSEVELLKLQ